MGCGNFGAAMIWSIGTMPVLVGAVTVAPALLMHTFDGARFDDAPVFTAEVCSSWSGRVTGP